MIRYNKDKLPEANEIVQILPIKNISQNIISLDKKHKYSKFKIEVTVIDKDVYAKSKKDLLGYHLDNVVPVKTLEGNILLVPPIFLVSNKDDTITKTKKERSIDELLKDKIEKRIAQLKKDEELQLKRKDLLI